MHLIVTVCQLPDEPPALEAAWADLRAHAVARASELVLLPEMPFSPWLAHVREPSVAAWEEAIACHDCWLARLDEVGAPIVVGTRPILSRGRPYNEAFIWERGVGLRPAHRKVYLPEEPGWWEASWYARGEGGFEWLQAGPARMGFLVCTELWFTAHARDYAKQRVHLLLSPRSTGAASLQKWLVGGRAAAVISGAYGLSSNRAGHSAGIDWGGGGWIVDPDGEVLAVTSDDGPFASADIDLACADAAKASYPRYVEG